MKNIERFVILALIVAVAILAYGQFGPAPDSQLAQKVRGQFTEVTPIDTSGLIIGAGRYDLKLTQVSEGQRKVLIRFDSATGDYAVLDTELGAWVAVKLPLIEPQGKYDNDAHIRLISDIVFD
ncbi:MAG: hypothetical protein AAGA45_04915 [Verrucomicrobiota bacterium]